MSVSIKYDENFRPMNIYDPDDPNLYVVAVCNNDWLGRAIRFFSEWRTGQKDYDHIVLVHRGQEYHVAFPFAQKRPARYRDQNVLFHVEGNIHEALIYAERITQAKTKYGTWQVISKAFTMLFGIAPIRARMDCIEFVVRALDRNVPIDVDRITVGQGVDYLLKSKRITYLTQYNK